MGTGSGFRFWLPTCFGGLVRSLPQVIHTLEPIRVQSSDVIGISVGVCICIELRGYADLADGLNYTDTRTKSIHTVIFMQNRC